ncbi:SRPBCC family protein [Winogradskya humida]|uniref:Polyketide cyclase n=1 Tax=Winogradskya humida TaxID=113566 RepID=A0ABQ3ZGQ7_9ACTN|nr:SRPBCC family protein [Actinoplanes humidus]GIE17763.1 polyketide cyclase [Actinoplanes humidus]
MITVDRTFTVTAAPAAVLEYLRDFGNTEQWDPGTQSTTRTDAGPIVAGSTWHNVSKVLGITTELTYTLQEATSDRLVFVGRNDGATSTDTITVRPAEGGSEVNYHLELQMHGAAKLATPVMKFEFEKLGTETAKSLTETLNKLG